MVMVSFTLFGSVESYKGRRGVLYIADDEIPKLKPEPLKTPHSKSVIDSMEKEINRLSTINDYLLEEVMTLRKVRNSA